MADDRRDAPEPGLVRRARDILATGLPPERAVRKLEREGVPPEEAERAVREASTSRAGRLWKILTRVGIFMLLLGVAGLKWGPSGMLWDRPGSPSWSSQYWGLVVVGVVLIGYATYKRQP